MNVLRSVVWIAALLGCAVFSLASDACPFCEGERGPTLVGQFDEAQMVLYGHFENARIGGGAEGGETDLVIERVLKSHEAIKGKEKLTLQRHIPDSKSKYIIFADIYKGRIDPYKGVQLTDNTEMLRYVEGVMKLKGKSQPERLRYAFDYLNSPEIEVAMDAYREFARADYQDYKDMAQKLPADTIAGWLQDPKTSAYRYGLYASLLGHCGKAEHAKLLLSMIEDPEKSKGSGLHGLMAAYTMLEKEKGWEYVRDLVKDKNKPFMARYAGLQTMRFFKDTRKDLVKEDEIVKGVALVLSSPDMADFAIEDLRKWKQWQYSDQILDLFSQKGFSTPIVRKSILRYALQCPTERAVAFVKTQQDRDAEWFNDTKELLELDAVPAVK